jgi:hypothetical protein
VAAQLGVPGMLASLQAQYRADRRRWRAWLMRPQPTPVAPEPDDAPWPDSPPVDDPYDELALGRGPPADGELDEMTAALAIVESGLGPVHQRRLTKRCCT